MAELLDGWDSTQEVAAFSTGGDQEKAQGSSNYFLDSADKGMEFLHKRCMQAQGQHHQQFGTRAPFVRGLLVCSAIKGMHDHHHPQGDLCRTFATLYTIW
jgi:hypothetical protein